MNEDEREGLEEGARRAFEGLIAAAAIGGAIVVALLAAWVFYGR